MILVTGGSGFIGSHFIDYVLENTDECVINLDSKTYAANNIERTDSRYTYIEGGIENQNLIYEILSNHNVSHIINFAAESAVGRSILDPEVFLQTNIFGTYQLLEATRRWSKEKPDLRFHHVSTDEVYGTLSDNKKAFSENTPYRPNTPYAASKASSDHLVRAWATTYGVNATITNCSNNYGPRQHKEKLLPLIIDKAINGKPITLHGDGSQVRDWIHVKDHARAIFYVAMYAKPGERYNVGAKNEKTNLELATFVCTVLDKLAPKEHGSYLDQIVFVEDRPGNDKRYASDNRKLRSELGWSPETSWDAGVIDTISWYLKNNTK